MIAIEQHQPARWKTDTMMMTMMMTMTAAMMAAMMRWQLNSYHHDRNQNKAHDRRSRVS